jgi:hypothetical protein
MKTRKLFGILVLIAIIAALTFTACDTGVSNGGKSRGGGNNNNNNGNTGTSADNGGGATIITNSDGSGAISNVQVKLVTQLDVLKLPNGGILSSSSLSNYTDTNDFSYVWDYNNNVVEPISNVPSIVIQVINGKLNMLLGIPKDEDLLTFRPDSGVPVIPSDAKVISLGPGEDGFITFDNTSLMVCFKDYSQDVYQFVSLIYVNKDVIVKGTIINSGYTIIYDCSFKKGWNYFLTEGNEISKTGTLKSSQTLPSGYNWVVAPMLNLPF